MKSLFFLVVLIAVSTTNHLMAQDVCYDKGSVIVTGGVGFPDLYRASLRTYYRGYASEKISGFGPVILKGDYGIYKFKWGHSVGAGIVLGFNTTKATFTYRDWVWNWASGSNGYYADYTQTDKYTTLTVGARGTYHFYTKEKIDCYASLGLGFNINMHSQTTNDPSGIQYKSKQRPGLYEAGTVGIRYYFTQNFGVYSELGWDNSTPVQAGLTFKFK